MIRRFVATTVSAVLVAAGAVLGLTLTAAPASAAYCSSATGVNTVVDYTELGGVAQGCGSGTNARAAFLSAGHSLAGGPGGPDTVCRVDGLPAAGEECWGKNSDHWYLFISRQGGAWSTATVGIDALRVKPGDTVALVWEGGTSNKPPSVAAAKPVSAPAPTPTKAPTKAPTAAPTKAATKAPTKAATKAPKPTKAPTKAPTTAPLSQESTQASAQTSAKAPTVAPTATPGASEAQSPTQSPTQALPEPSLDPSPAAETSPATAATTSDSGGLPTWALIVVVGVLAGASSIIAWRRKNLR